MFKNFLIPALAICLLFSGCSKDNKDKDVLLTVNDEEIYEEELEKITPKYEEKGLTKAEIVEGMVLELAALQQADNLSVSVGQEDVESRYDELVNLDQPLFYEKALEQYGSDDDFKQALYYKLVYNEVANKISELFSRAFTINKELLKVRTSDYASQYKSADFEENDMDEKGFYDEVMQTYCDSLLTGLEDLYFKVWQYKTVKESSLTYVNYNGSNLFEKQDYSIDADSLKFKGETYQLKNISFREIQEGFGNYFYLPSSIKASYGSITGKSIHIPAKDVRGLCVTLGTDSPITIKLIVAPVLSLYNNFQGNTIVTGTEDGLNKIEFVQPDMGIYYSIIADMGYQELEQFLNRYIPYTKADSTGILTPLDKYAQRVELTNGYLFFNSVTQTGKDMVYFNEDTARLEKWDIEQVTNYLGASFIPSFIPKDLEPCQASYNGTFISECKDNTTYWTVAYDGDSIIYDNFGMLYSDSFDEEYDPLRRKLLIEVSKSKIPISDVLYSFDTTEASKVKNNELTVGLYKAPYYEGKSKPVGYTDHYIAEFTINDVGYRIISENLTQEEFTKALISMPVFQ